MIYFVAVLLVVFGFNLGYFLQAKILFIVSLGSLAYVLARLKGSEGLDSLILIIQAAIALVINLTMWATWYFSSGQVFVGNFIKSYFIR
jgi:hypothetical protein